MQQMIIAMQKVIIAMQQVVIAMQQVHYRSVVSALSPCGKWLLQCEKRLS